MDLGKLIKKERKAAGISQKEMAQDIGLSEVHYCGIENNKRATTINVLDKVATKLKKRLVITFIDKD